VAEAYTVCGDKTRFATLEEENRALRASSRKARSRMEREGLCSVHRRKRHRFDDRQPQGLWRQARQPDRENEIKGGIQMSETEAVRTEDRLCLEEFELSEDAINTIATMMGFTIADIMLEKKKENPDEKRVKELEEKLSKISDERQEIYFGNVEMKHSVIERYSEYIRERVANA
jgi:hypothetical protein